MDEVDLPDAVAEIAKPTAAAEQMVEPKVAEPAAKTQPDENNNNSKVTIPNVVRLLMASVQA